MTDTATKTVGGPTDEVTAEATPVAGGSEAAPDGEAAAAEAVKRSTVDDLPLGPTKTRTGAEATVIQGPKGKRVFTAGGDKGAKIKELLETRKDLSRKEIAELVGSSQSRVAEVARVLGLSSSRPAPSSDASAASDAAPAAEGSPDAEAAATATEPATETASAAT